MSSSSEPGAAPALPRSELEPVPVPGCLICGAAGRRRERLRSLGCGVSRRSCNDIIRQHPHRRATDEKGATA
ncbi:hypothetical protein [Streptomyces sp. 3211]|uniref:hypothetical protein n=1 Tax=Streptomyces sp. 3211 TaxID=1964449 RepID=UPI001331966B|nr:hypothetical protein [Streptomyces sp. 3211]